MVAGRLFPKGLGRKNPFLDSGSTLVKASQGNRKGIGIGIDNEEGRIAAEGSKHEGRQKWYHNRSVLVKTYNLRILKNITKCCASFDIIRGLSIQTVIPWQ